MRDASAQLHPHCPLATLLDKQCAELVAPRYRKKLDAYTRTVQTEPASISLGIYEEVLGELARLLALGQDAPGLSVRTLMDVFG
ncbi:MAG TPA: hypothetical protein VMF89_12345 [Polyangiales bacterium]|nr:hypothetical protein [Polyangiales bacterium]